MSSEAITRNDLENILNDIFPPKSEWADYVVEQGESGIWTYIKWNSGRMECYGTYTESVAINTSSSAYGGYRSALITATAFPIAFTSTPTIVATARGAGGWWVNNLGDTNATNAKFYLSSGASVTASNRAVSIYAVGKWK